MIKLSEKQKKILSKKFIKFIKKFEKNKLIE